jgi:hypothetical protein
VVWQNHEHQTKVRHCFSQVRIPAVLHVCQQSRNEILPRYTMVSLDDAEREEHRRQWYVNFEIDTVVFVGYDYILDKAFEALGEHSRMIRSLAFSLDLYGDIPERSVRSMRRKLPHLDAIYIHVGDKTQQGLRSVSGAHTRSMDTFHGTQVELEQVYSVFEGAYRTALGFTGTSFERNCGM